MLIERTSQSLLGHGYTPTTLHNLMLLHLSLLDHHLLDHGYPAFFSRSSQHSSVRLLLACNDFISVVSFPALAYLSIRSPQKY
ncbi:hypothetical protein E6O75_ATG06629 [Venturia nashicola]|uniref:Uncharacterized protein n=1 Tax=Venturia nashicola TaxID=86259 RepID=A0A4Z1NYD3_9PEZI|nr:hypothetical protein E6O75_ATG06629 [Venturia nashicola]